MKLFYTISLMFIIYLPVFTGSRFYHPLIGAAWANKDRNEIPVLCYHNITLNGEKEDPLWIGKERFSEQLKMLYDSGYHTILPGQLYEYLTKGTPLPSKPIILSFDDSHEAHYSIASPAMHQFGFKGVFFVMTVCIGKKGYLTPAQIKDLSDSGHVIGCHTYDHPFLTTLKEKQWEKQIDRTKQTLQEITGKRVEYFAYPYGVWNDFTIIELKKHGIKAAFQLAGKQSISEPLFTLRRLMVSGLWSGKELQKHMSVVFRVSTDGNDRDQNYD